MNCRTVPLFRHYNSTIIAINFDFNIIDVSAEECVSYSFNHILVDCNHFTLLVQKLKFHLFFKFLLLLYNGFTKFWKISRK